MSTRLYMRYPNPTFVWTRLTQSRRALLWSLAHRPPRTLVHMDITMAYKRMLAALEVEGLIAYELGPQKFFVRVTPKGRALVEAVVAATIQETSDQLWAWLRSGPGLKTRPDF